MIEIPNFQEPIISVGIILPEDKQKRLIIIDSRNKQKINIGIEKNNLVVNKKLTDSLSLIRGPQNTENSYFIIKSVIAGRGFHWQKKISIKVKRRPTYFKEIWFNIYGK